MKRGLLSLCFFAISLLIALPTSSVLAEGEFFVQKDFGCPTDDEVLQEADSGEIKITDVLISANGPTTVTLEFARSKKRVPIWRVHLVGAGGGRATVDLQTAIGGGEGEDVVVTCDGEATVSITLVGTK